MKRSPGNRYAPHSRHDFPPFTVRKIPNTCLRRSAASAYMTSGSEREIARLILPHSSPGGSPRFNCVQLPPKSSLRQIPFIDPRGSMAARSEEHTSELQSQSNLVCRLLLEKKNHLRRT